MKLNGRRESSNVEDRRGKGGGKMVAGGGIGAILIAVIFAYFQTGDLGSALQAGMSQVVTVDDSGQQTEYTPSEEEQELAKFASQILAGTEDVWTEEFRKMGKTYEAPGLVLFSSRVQSACGGATSASGPFYCSGDQKVYIDLSFFMNMKKQLGADGDFAYAYVIAHEVGHHVQYLLGTLGKAHQQMSQVSQAEANKISVRLELQADCYAGVWANRDNARFGSLEEGDIEEAINAASKIGDDYLQKKAQGYTVPESFNHGTSSQRMAWLKKGLQSGDIRIGDTFSQSYNEL